jgi:hypothetical protein
LLLIFTPSAQTSNEIQQNLELITKKDNSYNPYNIAVLSGTKEDDFLKTIKTLDSKRSSVDITKAIAVYDKEIKNKYDNLFGSLINLLQPTIDAKQTILNIINDFNIQSRNSSTNIQKNCIELMKNSYDHGVFATWKSLDDIEITKQKIDSAKKLVEKQNEESRETIEGSAIAAVVSFTTGDIFSAATYIGLAGKTMFESLSSTKQIQYEEKQIIKAETENIRGLNIQKKRDLENNLYIHSKFYCSYGYNLQLSFDENTNILNIYGDKIDYNWMINLIDILQENLKLAISTKEKDDNSKVEYLLLKSTLQRLEILKEITNELSHIINFSFETHIMNIQIQPSKNTVNEIQNYFNDQMNRLQELNRQLNEMYPKDKELLLKEKKIFEERIEVEIIKQQILDFQSNATNIIKQKSAERYASDLASSWIAAETYIKSWVNISENSLKLTGSSLGILTKEISDVIGQIPKALIDSNLELFNSILFKLLTNPSGWIFLSLPLFIFLFYFGYVAGIISTFTWSGRKFITIVYGGFVFVYELIKTPFGYLFKQEKVFISQPVPVPALDSTQKTGSDKDLDENAPVISSKSLPVPALDRTQKKISGKDLDDITGAFSSLKIGGYKRKNRKTRKNKKHKTRKLKFKNKRHYTKHVNYRRSRKQ